MDDCFYNLCQVKQNILESKFLIFSRLDTDGLHRVLRDHLQFWDSHHYVKQYDQVILLLVL